MPSEGSLLARLGPRSIFPEAHVPGKNGPNSIHRCDGELLRGHFSFCRGVSHAPVCYTDGKMKQEFLEAGKIVNTFGVRGEVKLQPWCDSADFLRSFKTLYIDGQPRRVVASRVHKEMLIALFEGVEDLNAAMALKNKVVYFARQDVKLPDGRFFIADILGADVIDEDGRAVGKLTDVLELPAGQVYVVEGEDGEHTIPNREEFILAVDANAGVIRVHLIEGM